MRERERDEREMRETFHIKVSHRKNTEFYKHMICCSEVLVADFYLSVPLANFFLCLFSNTYMPSYTLGLIPTILKMRKFTWIASVQSLELLR